jgi:hypothetical protein
MAQPFPPQGNQTQHTERPLKIYAEQYLAAAALPIHVVTYAQPPVFAAGTPRVYVGTTVYVVHEGDYVISNRYSGKPMEVISAEEFAERFGGGPPSAEER